MRRHAEYIETLRAILADQRLALRYFYDPDFPQRDSGFHAIVRTIENLESLIVSMEIDDVIAIYQNARYERDRYNNIQEQ